MRPLSCIGYLIPLLALSTSGRTTSISVGESTSPTMLSRSTQHSARTLALELLTAGIRSAHLERVFVGSALVAAFAPAALPAQSGCADDGEWKHVGLGGGGAMTAIAFDPTDSNRFVVATDCAGVFRTCDGGATWTGSTRGLSDYYVQETALHPTDDQRIFAATLDGLSRSTDDGESWSTILELPLDPGHANFATIVVDPYDPEVVWAGIGTFREAVVANAGDDPSGLYSHVWRSSEGGAPGTWQPLDRIVINGNEIVAGIHTIVPCIAGGASLPGADGLIVSTTDGVFFAVWTGSAWQWIDITVNLPHRDCRDIEVVMDRQTGAFERLYLVLGSHSAPGNPASIYDSANGWGGGVWTTTSPTQTWSPTSFANGSDGLHLERANESYCSCVPAGCPCQPAPPNFVCKPKNMRHIALDRDRGYLYLALTERSTQTEGVWRADVDAAQWTWERMTITHDNWVSCHDGETRDNNVDFDYFPTIGAVMALEVEPVSGDVIFGTMMSLYRCSGGNCVPGEAGALNWQPLHTVITPGTPDVFRLAGLELTQVYQTTVLPESPSVLIMAESDHGLVRSDDAGANWRYLGLASQPQYSPYGTRFCRGIFRNPGIPDEWLGIFGRWPDPTQYELYRTLDGVPSDSSAWTQILPTQGDLQLRDVLFLDGTHVLVAEQNGLYQGVRDGSGQWTFSAQDLSAFPNMSHDAYDLAVAPGTGIDRRVLAAFTWEPSKLGGILRRDTWSGAWVAATHTGFPADDFKSIQCLEWSATDPNVVFAGRASGGTGITGAVLLSEDAGATWSTTAGQGLFSNPKFDVVGLSSIVVPETGSMVERLFVATRPVLAANGATWYPEIFGGVFHSDDQGATWIDRSAGLDFGFSIFVSRDPVHPYRLHYGTRGGGAWTLDDGVVTGIVPAFMAESARQTSPSGSISYACTQQIIHLRNELDGSQRFTERAFLDFPLTSLSAVPPAQIARVELELNVLDGANWSSTAVQARRMTNSADNLWNPPPPPNMSCGTLFGHINSTTTYASVAGWTQSQTRKRFDLGPQAVVDLRSALQGSGVFSVGLKLAAEGPLDPNERIELYNVTGDHRLFVSYDL
jgi:hypothetical protein